MKKTLMLAVAGAALTLSACSGYRYEPCPFAGISNVDVTECQATQNTANVKAKAKPISNPQMTTPEGRYNTCPFAGIDGVAKRDCKAITGTHNISAKSKPALKTQGYSKTISKEVKKKTK